MYFYIILVTAPDDSDHLQNLREVLSRKQGLLSYYGPAQCSSCRQISQTKIQDESSKVPWVNGFAQGVPSVLVDEYTALASIALGGTGVRLKGKSRTWFSSGGRASSSAGKF